MVPPYGGETLIANAAAAYRDLPEPLRAFADTLWAVHTDDYDGLPRRLNRVTAAGDIPVGVNGERSHAITGDASHYSSVADLADLTAAA